MSTFFSEKQQKPQQVLKPLIYDRQTNNRQINFTDKYFPINPFYINLTTDGLCKLRKTRLKIIEIFFKEVINGEK